MIVAAPMWRTYGAGASKAPTPTEFEATRSGWAAKLCGGFVSDVSATRRWIVALTQLQRDSSRTSSAQCCKMRRMWTVS